MPDPSLIIAISRQRGSGGAEVGRQLAAELGLRYIDRQLLRHAAEFLQAQDDRAGARATTGSWWSRIGEAMAMGATSFTHAPPSLAALSERRAARHRRAPAERDRRAWPGCDRRLRGGADAEGAAPGDFGVPARAELAWRHAPRVRALRAGWPGRRTRGPRVGPEPLPFHPAADRRPVGHTGVLRHHSGYLSRSASRRAWRSSSHASHARSQKREVTK